MLLADQITSVPRVYDEAAATRLLDAHSEILSSAPENLRELVAGVGGASPYLARLMLSQRIDIDRLFQTSLEENLSEACNYALSAGDASEKPEQMVLLRKAKSKAALTVALAEISGAWSTMEAAEALSDFADAALTGALRACLRAMVLEGFVPEDIAAPEVGCGIVVLAMGKHGARELNYSSDIDIIVLFDAAASPLGERAREIAVWTAKNLVTLLQEQTSDGYVFRTDLRLRPDPGVSAAAISIGAAETYYEAHGQNWERAAFIKARAAAGDIKMGERFLDILRPFIWRRYLDFAAIEDIHSIKRQIHAAKGGATIDFFGHDLKTGRGGIREIEFLTQTQQLILGGKNESLRSRRTLDALADLTRIKQVTESAQTLLVNAYTYLRKVEHRIQMINDEQTHKIPTSEDGVERLAAFLGEERSSFQDTLKNVLEDTHAQFADLFQQEERLSSAGGTLSFTGVENNPETLDSLKALGFMRPETVSATVRTWHAGGLRATRPQRARELLTKLTPRILESLGAASDPDAAFMAFDLFLSHLPSGLQIFSLLTHTPAIFDRLIRIMTVAPYLGKELARRRQLVEGLLEHDWPRPLTQKTELTELLAKCLSNVETFEDKLNSSRRWAHEEKFQITAQLVLGLINPIAAGRAYTDLADSIIQAIVPVAYHEMVKSHGEIEGTLAVLGLGRLGAGTLTATSDIDLIFIYDSPAGVVSNGYKPLDATTYFNRFVRRILTALTAVTEEGTLYEVDMQLRPSGGAGPATVSTAAFMKYFSKDAWTWEVMALTKARIIDGSLAFRTKLDREIEQIIARQRDQKKLVQDVHEMRLRLLAAKPSDNIWDLKNISGGITELDFIHQYLQLLNGSRFSVEEAEMRSIEGIKDKDLKTLATASDLYQSVMQLSRAATGSVFAVEGAGLALKERMSEACNVDRLEAAESLMICTERDVKHIYDALIGNVAKAKG